MLDHMKFDAAALKTRLIQRHGVDVGEMVFNAEVNRRAIQDARSTELAAEIAALDVQVSTLAAAAGIVQTKLQAGIEATYTHYLKQCEDAARINSMAQAQITPLQNRSIELQQQLRTLVQPRLTERELSDVAIYNSTTAELQRKKPTSYA
jgi:xylose isomerase